MAYLVEFKKDYKKHPVSKRGDIKSVSASIRAKLLDEKVAIDHTKRSKED